VARDRLLDLVWGEDTYVTDRVIDNHVANLRKKIEDDTGAPRFVVSVRGVGYRFDG
jgi:DNA-binding response OmpR family regulator